MPLNNMTANALRKRDAALECCPVSRAGDLCSCGTGVLALENQTPEPNPSAHMHAHARDVDDGEWFRSISVVLPVSPVDSRYPLRVRPLLSVSTTDHFSNNGYSNCGPPISIPLSPLTPLRMRFAQWGVGSSDSAHSHVHAYVHSCSADECFRESDIGNNGMEELDIDGSGKEKNDDSCIVSTDVSSSSSGSCHVHSSCRSSWTCTPSSVSDDTILSLPFAELPIASPTSRFQLSSSESFQTLIHPASRKGHARSSSASAISNLQTSLALSESLLTSSSGHAAMPSSSPRPFRSPQVQRSRSRLKFRIPSTPWIIVRSSETFARRLPPHRFSSERSYVNSSSPHHQLLSNSWSPTVPSALPQLLASSGRRSRAESFTTSKFNPNTSTRRRVFFPSD